MAKALMDSDGMEGGSSSDNMLDYLEKVVPLTSAYTTTKTVRSSKAN
jgi:hypothetical protein